MTVPDFREIEEVPIQKYENGHYRLIETEEALVEVAEGLKLQEMIGVDLENNHLKTYNGFLCLIQISTLKNENYLIDAI